MNNKRRRGYRKRKAPTLRKSVKKAVVKAKNTMFSNKVRRVVNNLAEKKIVRYNYSLGDVAGVGYYNSVSWGLDNGLFVISPINNRLDINQGDGQAQRTGNRIRTYSAWLNCNLVTAKYNATYNPTPTLIDCLVYIYRVKAGGNTVQTVLSGFYQDNNSSIAPTVSQLDTLLPTNTDSYTVLWKRMFKLGFAENAATGNDANQQRYSNNDYKRSCRFRVNLTKFYNKIYRYSDTDDTPFNSLLYMAILPVNADGTIPGIGNGLRPVQCFISQSYRFTDI